MLLLSYIRRHIPMHIVICTIYSILFLVQLIMVGEIFTEYGLNTYSISERTYNFVLNNIDEAKLDSLRVSLGDYEDVCYVLETNEINLVSYPNGTSEERGNKVDLEGLKGEYIYCEAASDAQMRFNEVTNEIEQITGYEINGDFLSIAGSVSISDTYSKGENQSVYCSYGSFLKHINDENEIIVSVLSNERLNSQELTELKNIIRSNAGVFEYEAVIDRLSEFDALLSVEMSQLVLLMILIAFSFVKLMNTILEQRNLEYRVLNFCGASNETIEGYKFIHLLSIVLVSSIIGIILFLVLRLVTGKYLIAYERDSVLFYSLNIGLFLIISVISVVLGNAKLKKLVRK